MAALTYFYLLKGELRRMDESKQTDDRWREMLELLGLPPETPGTKSAPAPAPRRMGEEPPPAARPPARLERETPPPPLRVERVEEELPRMEPVPAEASVTWELEFDAADDDTAIDESQPRVAEAVPAGEAPAEGAAPPAGDEEQPRRGRRRRRRGRRRGGNDAPEGEAGAATAAPGGAPVKTEVRAEPRESPARPSREREADPRDRHGGRGGRGRGRRDDEDPRRRAPARQERSEPAPVHAEVPYDEPAAADDALAAEDTDFSNWNVPSWQDLISSLYRPDR